MHVEYLQGDLQIGGVFLLASDGVHGALKEARLYELARQGDTQAASDAIVRAALAADAADNVTALVLRVLGLTRLQLADAAASARQLSVSRRLNVGGTIEGLVVTARVAETGVHLLYQVRDPASGALKALKTLRPSRAADPQERAMLAHEAWLSWRVTRHAEDGFVRLVRRAGRSHRAQGRRALSGAALLETAEELVLALERGAWRPLAVPPASPLAARDPLALWMIAFGVSLLLNALLVFWLLFVPR